MSKLDMERESRMSTTQRSKIVNFTAKLLNRWQQENRMMHELIFIEVLAPFSCMRSSAALFQALCSLPLASVHPFMLALLSCVKLALLRKVRNL